MPEHSVKCDYVKTVSEILFPSQPDTHTHCEQFSIRKEIFQHQHIKTNVSKNTSLKKSAQNTVGGKQIFKNPACISLNQP